MDVTLPGTMEEWLDTGLTLSGETCALDYECDGTVFWNWETVNGTGRSVLPDGVDPAGFPANASVVRPYGVALLLLPDGETPGAHPGSLEGGTSYATGVFDLDPWVEYPPTVFVSGTIDAETLAAGYSGSYPARVWAIVNDDVPWNNDGSFALTLNTDCPDPEPGEPATGTPPGDTPSDVTYCLERICPTKATPATAVTAKSTPATAVTGKATPAVVVPGQRCDEVSEG